MALGGLNNLNIALTMQGVLQGLNQIQTQLQQISNSTNGANAGLANMGKSVSSGFGGAGALISGTTAGILAAGAAIYGVGKFLISTNAEFQKLHNNLQVATGSVAGAEEAFAALQNLAKTTPFTTDEVTTAFINLKNLGLDPSQKAIISYGNTAASMGKSLDQMIQAVADASTGEFERLKEFGIKAKVQGDQVAFTFQGVTTKVKNNSQEIQGYLKNIGETTFGGAGALQAKTMGAAFGNLTDNIKIAAYTFGKAGFNEGVTNLINAFAKGTDSSEMFLKALGKLAGEGLTAIANSLSNAMDAVNDFLNSMTTLGGETSTVGELITATFYTVADTIRDAFGAAQAFLGDFFASLQVAWADIAYAWNNDVGYIRTIVVTVFNFISNYIINAINIAAKVIVALPKLITGVFKSIAGTFSTFFQAAKDLFSGNLNAFDNFWKRADWGKLSETTAPIFDAIGKAQKDLAAVWQNPGQMTGPMNDFFNQWGNRTRQHLKEVKASNEAARAAANNNGEDPLAKYNTPGKPDASGQSAAAKKASDKAKREREKAERDEKQRLERLKSAFDNLADTYLPAIGRQQKLAEALKNINDLADLSPDKLKAMGISLDMLGTITERVTKALNETFFDKQMAQLKDDAADLAYGNDIAGVSAQRLAEIVRDAGKSYEDLSEPEKQRLLAQITYNEQLSREKEMRESMKGRFDDLNDEIRLLGLVGKERDRQSKLLEVEREAREKGLDPSKYVSQYSAALDRLEEETKKYNTIGFGFKSAVSEYAENATNIAEQTKSAVSGIFDSLEDNLTKFITTGKFSFKDFLGSIGQMLAKFAAQQAVMSFLNLFGMGGGGSTVLGSLFGGFRANGGDVQQGKAYVVGEKRPELFVPKTNGTILPSVPTGGRSSGGGSMTINPAISLSVTIEGNGSNIDLDALEARMHGTVNTAVNSVMRQIINERRHGGFLN